MREPLLFLLHAFRRSLKSVIYSYSYVWRLGSGNYCHPVSSMILLFSPLRFCLV